MRTEAYPACEGDDDDGGCFVNTPEKCPKCGQPLRGHWFLQCVIDQRDQLTTKLAALKSANAECADKMKRYRSRWLAAHKRIMEMENEAERASECVKRLECAAGLALGYASKGDFETADELLRKAKG